MQDGQFHIEEPPKKKKPVFDPNKPFTEVNGKPAFDPSKPFEGISEKKNGVGISPLPSSDGFLPGQLPEKPKRDEFSAIENVLVENRNADKRLREAKGYGIMQAAGPGAVPVNTEFQKQFLQESSVYKKQTQDAVNAVLKANKDKLVKPIEDLISSGQYKQFIKSTGVFDLEKAIPYFDEYVKKRGGGQYVRETMVTAMKQAAEREQDKPRLKELLTEEYKKQNIDVDKYGQTLYDKEVQPKLNSLSIMKVESKQKAAEYLEQVKPLAAEIGGQYQQQVSDLNNLFQSGQISESDANAQLQAINNDYIGKISELDKSYNQNIKNLNKGTADKYARITKEIESIGKSITSDKIWESIPKEDKRKIELAQQEAYGRLNTEKNEAKKATDIAIAMTGFNPLASLFSKPVASGWNQGLADLGDYLSFKGFDNRMVRSLQAKRTKAEELAPAEYSWQENPFMRAISSAGTSLGASLPVTGTTTALALASGGLGLPALVTTIGVGLTGYAGEKMQNVGGVYRELLEKTGDPSLALQGAEDFSEKQTKTIPLYFISAVGLQNLLKSGLRKTAIGTVQELAEELPTEYYQGFTQAQATEDYQKTFGQYIKENPQLSLDVIAGTLGQSGVISGASKIYQNIFKKAPNPKEQFYTDMIQKGGVNVAIANLRQQLDNDIISPQEYDAELLKIQEVVSMLGTLKDLGLKGDDAKAFIAFSGNIKELTEKAAQEPDETIRLLYNKKIAEAKTELTEITSGNGVYAVVEMPGGNNQTTIMRVEDLTDSVIKNAESITIKNDKLSNKDIQEKKKQLGNPANAPIGMYEEEAKITQPEIKPEPIKITEEKPPRTTEDIYNMLYKTELTTEQNNRTVTDKINNDTPSLAKYKGRVRKRYELLQQLKDCLTKNAA